MRKTPLFIAATLVAATAFTSVAMAHEGRKGARGMGPAFEELDANGDGSLTLAEIEARAQARFAETDTNGDGLISAEEMTAAMDKAREGRAERRIRHQIERMDANGDGLLSIEEMAEGRRSPASMFDRVDADGDGVITEDEWAEARPKRGRDRDHN